MTEEDVRELIRCVLEATCDVIRSMPDARHDDLCREILAMPVTVEQVFMPASTVDVCGLPS